MRWLTRAGGVTLWILVLGSSFIHAGVALTEDSGQYTLNNGTISATISKSTGDLVSLQFQNAQMLDDDASKPAGRWHYAPQGNITASVTIDPTSNAGSRAEVAIRGIEQHSNAAEIPDRQSRQNIEIRYSLGDTDSGLYVYCILDHAANSPSVREFVDDFWQPGGFTLRLARQFDWLTVDGDRNGPMPSVDDWNNATPIPTPNDLADPGSANDPAARRMTTGPLKGEVVDRFDHAAVQFDTPFYGWLSTTSKTGLWIINASTEYLGGGPGRVSLTGFLNPDDGQPTLVNYWFSNQYGPMAAGSPHAEKWAKVIGPFLLYCNATQGEPAAKSLAADAHAQYEKESAAWPYTWVAGVDYPQRDQRGTVKGRISVEGDDAGNASNMLVGIVAPYYDSLQGFGYRPSLKFDPSMFFFPWPNDAKHYQYWVRAGAGGSFEIPNVRPGTYEMIALADGVAGCASGEGLQVAAGKVRDLGVMHWRPLRFGKTVWEIGKPNRSGREFLHGDEYWKWGLIDQFKQDFPTGVNYIVGTSDWKKDWNYAQTPIDQDSIWTIRFDGPAVPTQLQLPTQSPQIPTQVPSVPSHLPTKPGRTSAQPVPSGTVIPNLVPQPALNYRGKVILRIFYAATAGARGTLTPALNGRYMVTCRSPDHMSAADQDDFTIFHQGIQSIWQEKDYAWSANLLQAKDNRIDLHLVTAGGHPAIGVIYDYLRLEYNSDSTHPDDANPAD